MADENFIDLYYNEENKSEGIEIRGKNAVFLNSPAVLLYPEADLPTESRDLIEILNELFQSGNEGGDGYLRAIYDDITSSLMIRIEKVSDEEIIVADNKYSYTKTTFSESITINKTNADSTVTTTTKSFSKSIITNLYDPKGTEILRVECDEKGNVTGYFDSNNNKIQVS